MIVLYFILGFFGLIFLYLFIIIFMPVLKVESQPIKRELKEEKVIPFREDVSFVVGGLKLSGWLYLPEEKENIPCVVMNHGFCGTKDFALEDFALEFVKEGFAVLTFDFRYFGDSEGFPKNNYCGRWQVEDTKEAIKYVKSRKEINKDKIFVWGTSGGSNYGMIIASEDKSIAGVISQVGAYDHKMDNKFYIDKIGWGHFLKLFVHAQRDKGRSRFGLSPHVYPPYGMPNTMSFLNLPGTFEGIEELAKESRTFVNEIPGRIAINPHPENVLEKAENIECDVLVIIGKKDGLVSPNSHLSLLDILGDKAKLIELDVDHWAVYKGEPFKENIKAQLDFLNKHK